MDGSSESLIEVISTSVSNEIEYINKNSLNKQILRTLHAPEKGVHRKYICMYAHRYRTRKTEKKHNLTHSTAKFSATL